MYIEVDGKMCSLEELRERAALAEHVVVWDCPDLTTLPDIPKAIWVDIRNCPNLTTLPDLPRAKEVRIEHCPNLTTLPDFPRAKQVRIEHCPNLRNVIQGGRDSRGYEFNGIYVRGEWRVAAGCRFLTVPQAREHWRDNPECLELVERIATGIAEYEMKKGN